MHDDYSSLCVYGSRGRGAVAIHHRSGRYADKNRIVRGSRRLIPVRRKHTDYCLFMLRVQINTVVIHDTILSTTTGRGLSARVTNPGPYTFLAIERHRDGSITAGFGAVRKSCPARLLAGLRSFVDRGYQNQCGRLYFYLLFLFFLSTRSV